MDINESIRLDYFKDINIEKETKEKKEYLENSLSKEYIKTYLGCGMPFEKAVRRWLEEHIEDLLSRLHNLDPDNEEYNEKKRRVNKQTI